MTRPRIAIAGFQHETNTFAPIPTRYADFEQGGAWPGITEGAAVPEEARSMIALNVKAFALPCDCLRWQGGGVQVTVPPGTSMELLLEGSRRGELQIDVSLQPAGEKAPRPARAEA